MHDGRLVCSPVVFRGSDFERLALGAVLFNLTFGAGLKETALPTPIKNRTRN